MESSELYRMIEALLAGASGPSQPAASSDATAEPAAGRLEDLIQRVAEPVLQDSVVPAASRDSSSGSTGGGIAGTILKTFLGGLGMVSLFKGLFDGGSEPVVPPLVKYQPPAALNEETGYSAQQGFVPLSHDQSGAVRAPVSPRVTVQVNALDSRSFLDHSDEIASAVREAVLHSHNLRDVLTEL